MFGSSEFDKSANIQFNDGSETTIKQETLQLQRLFRTNTSNPYVMLGAGLVAKSS